jgi:hypothetical protein
MLVSIEEAVDKVFVTIQRRLPKIDLWYPDANAPGGFFEPQQGKSLLRAPLLMGDDGNLLLAAISALRSDGGPRADAWSRFANEGIRVLGSLLHRAAIDYGIHRLLLILVVPEDNEVYESLSTELSNARYTAGQFRIVLLPHRSQATEDFQQQLEQRLELLSPFPESPFLKPIDASDLADYVEEAFLKGSHRENACRQEVEQDLKAFLKVGSWAGGRRWPDVTKLIEAKMQVVLREKEGQ